MSRKSDNLAEKVRKALRAKELGKKYYARADALLEEIAAEAKPDQAISLSADGKTAKLVDRFKGKDIVWQPCAARRWEIEVHS